MNQEIKISSSNFVELNEPSKFQPQIQFETKSIPVERREPLLLEIEDFISGIEKGKPTMVTVNDGITALKVAEAAKESLNRGEVIHIV